MEPKKQIRTKIKANDYRKFFQSDNVVCSEEIMKSLEKRIEEVLKTNTLFLTITEKEKLQDIYNLSIVNPIDIIAYITSISKNEIEVLMYEDKFELFQRYIAQGYYANPRTIGIGLQEMDGFHLRSFYLICYDLVKEEDDSFYLSSSS